VALVTLSLLLATYAVLAILHPGQSLFGLEERKNFVLTILVVCQLLLLLLCLVNVLAGRKQQAASRRLQEAVQLQRSILDAAGPMMIATDMEGHLITCNPASERMFGYTAEEMLGVLKVQDLFPAGELERVGKLLVQRIDHVIDVSSNETSSENVLKLYLRYVTSFTASRVRGFEIQCRRKDESSFPAMLNLSAIRNPDGKVTGLLAIATDLSATKRAEQALRAQEKRATELDKQKEFILNSVADGIIGTDPLGRMMFANPAAAAMLHAAPAELVGLSAYDVLHPRQTQKERSPATGSVAASTAAASTPDQQGEHSRAWRAFLLRETVSGQDTFYRPDGSSFPVEFTMTPMAANGVATGSVLNFRDISQRNALDRMKDEFISTVSHELRTPLTSIRGALGLLSAGLLHELNEKTANLLRIAVSNSDRLVRLINDILDLERMQSGRAPLSFRQCSMEEIVQQAVDAMGPVAEAAHVSIRLKLEPCKVHADSDRLLQVMTNLLSNAIKFSPPYSEVTVKTMKSDDGALVAVVDEGRGVPEDKLELIFDRFQQVDASDSRQKGGTGLGLAICRTILEQHGGRIWAERNSDRGSSFYFCLADMPSNEAGAGPILRPQQEEGVVLLCDDDEPTRLALKASLQQHGYEVVEAESGPEAVAYAQEVGVDAILLDLTLPGMSGWQTLRSLKDNPDTASIPVVVLSAFSAPEETSLSETLVANADGWVTKPSGGQVNGVGEQEHNLLRELARVIRKEDERVCVLLVEDDEDLARIIMATFEQAGVEIFHASTRSKAIEMCQSVNPGIMILDLSLPDGDGFGVVDWLRQSRDLNRLPLIVYSARDVSDIEREQLLLGPTEFVTKARVQPQEVEALVRTMLSRYTTTGVIATKARIQGASTRVH
jgi:signal transduction histidine kinase/DNA-binding response OmpR family regulator